MKNRSEGKKGVMQKKILVNYTKKGRNEEEEEMRNSRSSANVMNVRF